MSNQEEEEVDDELEAMEREVNGVRGQREGVESLPDAPNVIQEEMPGVPEDAPVSAKKAREEERQPIAA